MREKIEELKVKIKELNLNFAHNKNKLLSEWEEIKTKCTHPDIGELLMYICPDCEYNGVPEWPEELAHRDYEKYNESIEKIRARNRSKKGKYKKGDILKMVIDIKEKIRLLTEKKDAELSNFNVELGSLKSKCNHANLNKNNYCNNCDTQFGELLF